MRFILTLLFLLPTTTLLAAEPPGPPDIKCLVQVTRGQNADPVYQQTFNVYHWQWIVGYQNALIEFPDPELGLVRVAVSTDGGDDHGKAFFALAFLFRKSDNQQLSRLHSTEIGKTLTHNFFGDYDYSLTCVNN